MKIKCIRDDIGATRTLGKLYVDDVYHCEVLEDPDRRLERGGIKIPGNTAIPRGVYQVVIDFSARFRRPMLHLLGVNQFDGVRVHGGNTHLDTHGCPITGRVRTADGVRDCAGVLADLERRVAAAIAVGEKVTWEVV